MYTKEELEQMEPIQLLSIAADLGVEVSQDDALEKVVYAILDQAAIDSAAGSSATKRKRTRIAKKDADKAENANLEDTLKADKNSEVQNMAVADNGAQVSQEVDQPVEEASVAPQPKRRGRKSKAELAEIAAAEERRKQQEAMEMQPVEEMNYEGVVPEAEAMYHQNNEPQDMEMIMRLQEKM